MTRADSIADSVRLSQPFREKAVVLFILVFSLLFVHAPGPTAQGEPLPSRETPTLHRVADGESLNEIAVQYLGGAEFVPELLEFNNINNPTAVVPGMLIALPGAVRGVAQVSIDRADAAIRSAESARAAKFAATTLSRAEEKLVQSRSARFRASYAQAIALAEVAAQYAKDAASESDAAARIARAGKVTRTHGLVELSRDGQSWSDASEHAEVPATGWVRTGPAGWAEITFVDGSVFEISRDSLINIQQHFEDSRTGDIDLESVLHVGTLLGRIKPKTSNSNVRIKSGQAAIAVRGTILRVRTDGNNVVHTEVLDGEVEIETPKRKVVVPHEHGVIARDDGFVSEPRKLLSPPRIDERLNAGMTTATRRVSMQWGANSHERPSAYVVEIAEDEDFARIIQWKRVNKERMTTDLLPEGDYHVRVMSIDHKGLMGVPGEKTRVSVRPNYDVAIWYDGFMVMRGEELLVPAANRYEARPVQEESSVAEIQYSMNGSPFRVLTDRLEFTEEGSHRIVVRGVGEDGVEGPEETLNVRVDMNTPRVTCRLSPPFEENGRKLVSVEFSAEDDSAVDRVEYRLNGSGKFKDYFGDIRLPANRQHLIEYRAIDMVGNQSETHRTNYRPQRDG
jgi:hypothetical protein